MMSLSADKGAEIIAPLKFVMTEFSKTQIRLTGPK